MMLRDYLNKLTDKEFDEFMWAFYYSGVLDGRQGLADSPKNSFSSTCSRRTADEVTSSLEKYTEAPVHETYLKKVGKFTAEDELSDEDIDNM